MKKPTHYTRKHNGIVLTLALQPSGVWLCSNGYEYTSPSAASRDIANVLGGPHWWSADTRAAARIAKKKGTRPSRAMLPSRPASLAVDISKQVMDTTLASVGDVAKLTRDLELAKSALRAALRAQLAKLG